MKKLPYFIIAGAPKCGTTALWHFLNQHPRIYLSPDKEPRFFTKLKGDMERSITGDGPRLSGNYTKGFGWYAGLFKNAAPGQVLGEASTVYFASEDAPGLIQENIPGAKLIMMLRHPVKRVYSHYWQEHKLGFSFPSFEQMVKENNVRLRYYKRISHYRQHILRYFNLFPQQQVHIIIQEEFNQSPELHFRKVLEFLELDYVPVDFNQRLNEQVTPKNRLLARTLALSKTMRLEKVIPPFVFEPVSRMRRKLVRANAKNFKYPPLSKDLFDVLMPEYREDIEFLENLFGRKITAWLS